MRKLAVLAVAVTAILATAAVAIAAQVNTYKVTSSISPTKAGSKKKPSAVRLNFDVKVDERGGQRPATVKRYAIGFYGIQTNGRAFKTCTARQINNAQSDAGCPKGAKVGAGTVSNNAGATANPADKTIPCDLDLTIYNAGRNRAALFLQGGPPRCAVTISQAVDARFVKFAGHGSALQFDVPAGLLHPIPGVDNAVVRIEATVAKKTARSHGRKVGYFESVGCKGRKRPIEVTFTPEHGSKVTAKTTAKCSR